MKSMCFGLLLATSALAFASSAEAAPRGGSSTGRGGHAGNHQGSRQGHGYRYGGSYGRGYCSGYGGYSGCPTAPETCSPGPQCYTPSCPPPQECPDCQEGPATQECSPCQESCPTPACGYGPQYYSRYGYRGHQYRNHRGSYDRGSPRGSHSRSGSHRR